MKRALATLILTSLLMSALPLNAAADETEDIPANAAATGVHETLVAALTQADLVTTLQGDGPFTVFAPTDAAFEAAGIDLSTFDTDEENATLEDILIYHVYAGSVPSSEVTDGLTVTMVNGDEATFAVLTDGTVKIGDATVTTADVQTSNGIIHIIDTVLMPPVVQSIDVFVDGGSMSAPYFNFYTDSAGTTPLVDNTLDITQTYNFHRLNSATSHPFYISDAGNGQAATTALMLSGDGSETSGITGSESFTLSFASSITSDATVNFFCTVHSSMVSEFVLTGFPVTVTDIPAVAQSTGIHTSLVAALAKADLVSALQAEGPFTVFAPTDAAFTAAGIDLAAFDSAEEIATLADILIYHVYVGAVASTDVTDGMTVAMLNGDNASFTVTADGVMIEGANVTMADVPASNGVIHVIDAVLMPPVEPVSPGDIPTVATGTGIHTALVAALAKADLVSALQAEGPFTVFAPTDAAFTAAGIDLDTFVTEAEIATLADILTYHVFAGAVASTDVTDGMTVAMLNGDNASFTVTADSVMIEGATVTMADVAASNGVIHVIDKVLMPPTDTVEEPVLEDCDATVGIAPSGLKFSPATVTIAVGDTVCWQWTDSSMAHNVREVDGDKSTTYTQDGITSGAAAVTVDFQYTFTEDTTFTYACEPHMATGMYGKVIVGTGGESAVIVEPDPMDMDDSEDTPGFMASTLVLAFIGAVLIMQRRPEQ
ncbi:MAG: fasciclin domain-containing protein [Euryarchaeota archaeon]